MRNRPTARPVSIGTELSVDVESLADGPDALCRVGKYILFVAGALPGERVRVRISSAGRKYGRAELLSIERRSPDRVGPRCEHFLDCGGCHFQHLAYPKQLEYKTERLAKTLGHALQAEALPILDMQGPENP
ncbi:MAG TPA: TRAM domain-containing protein, partial [bacterium]|nr:TRAM domain-containing protein [bacterium]